MIPVLCVSGRMLTGLSTRHPIHTIPTRLIHRAWELFGGVHRTPSKINDDVISAEISPLAESMYNADRYGITRYKNTVLQHERFNKSSVQGIFFFHLA